MRKEFGKTLRALFLRAMKERLPSFRETKVTSPSFWPGERAFCLVVTAGLHLWLVLSPSQKDYDMFTLLAGWSRLGRYPALTMIPSSRLPEEGHGEFEEAEYLFRLPSLWTREERWWVIREPLLDVTIEALMKQMDPVPQAEAERLVTPLVDEAMEKTETYALPYFEALLAWEEKRRKEE
jgi:hypothetical protein